MDTITVIILVIFALICGCLVCAFGTTSSGGALGTFFLGVLLVTTGTDYTAPIGLVLLLVSGIQYLIYRRNEKNGINDAKREREAKKEEAAMLEELKQIEREKIQAIESQKPGPAWKVRYSTDPCPHCGHYKVRNATWEDKRYSVAFWGSASIKLGTSFKCENCGQMW